MYQTNCVALTARNLVTAKKHVKEEKSAPSADRLDTMAVLAAMKRNAPTAQGITLPSARSVRNGSLKRECNG